MAITNGWGQGVLNNAIEWGQGAINNAIGWGVYYLTSSPGDTIIYGESIDPDAEAYVLASGITGLNQISVLTTFVDALKGVGTTNGTDVWSKIIACYPYTPINETTATLDAYKYNLKNPLDTDAAFRMTWLNSPTVGVTGVTGNGSNAYGNTNLNILDDIGSNQFGLYVGLRSQNTNGQADAGAIKSGTPFDGGQIAPYFSGADSSFVGQANNATLQVTRTGLIGVQHDGTLVKRSRDGVVYNSTATPVGTAQSINMYTLARAFGASPISHTTKEQNIFLITQALTDNEIADLGEAVTAYNANIITGGR